MGEGRKPGTAFWRGGFIAVAALLSSLGMAWAQGGPEAAPDPDRSRAEYEAVSQEVKLSTERLARLAADIATVKKDHASITAALIQSAKTEQKLGQDIEDIGARLEGLKGQETTIRASLAKRRDVLAEVLGALQRMGLNPPPAILVTPEDALSSVRSAILLGAVVPELRAQTDILVSDLKELTRVTASIEAERQRLTATVSEQVAEKQRLTMLLEAKRKLQAETESALAEEKKNSEALVAKAASLKELIASLEAEAKKRRKTAEAEQAAEAASAAQQGLASAGPSPAVPEANQLIASAPFSALRGQVALPVIGKIKQRFGASDGNGVRHPWRHGCDTIERHRHRTGGWRNSLCGAVPFLRSTLDPERRRRLSCGTGGDEQFERRLRPIRARGRAGRRDGRSPGSEHLGFAH